MTPSELIAEYLKYHAICNPDRPAPLVRYEGGWFRFKDFHNKGHRRAEFWSMLETLKTRSRDHSKGAM